MDDGSEPVEVLYADSDGSYAASLGDALRTHEELSVEHVADAETALSRLRAGAFDCVLAQRDLGATDAMTLMHRAREASPGIPFVLLVPDGAADVAAASRRAGANDYLVRRDPERTAAVAADRLAVAADHQSPGVDYQQVFEEATVGIVVHHPETGEIIDINPWMSELLGYDRSELLTMTVGEFSAGEEPYTQDQAERNIRRAATEGPQRFEWLDERADGEPVPVEVSLRRTVIGGHDRVLAIVQDITERKEREASLRRQSRRMEEFAGVVSHDIRSPLTVAEGWVDYALGDDEGIDEEAALERILQAIERMDEMIDDSLTLVRGGGEVDATEPVPMAEEAPEWWEVAATADAELVVDTPFTVEADPNRLRHLFENLFRNSVEHGSTSSRTESGDSVEHGSTGSRPPADDSVEHGSTSSRTQSGDSVEHDSTGSRPPADDSVEHGGTADGDHPRAGVTVRTGPLTVDDPVEPTVGSLPDEGSVEGFYVEDDGPGIPPDEHDRVFEAGHTTDANGTGLGLAIVRRVADAHGWAIRLGESDSGGARFEFLGATLRANGEDDSAGEHDGAGEDGSAV
ncbi:ATP-binding protein [Haloglomus litoreum]|uniref:receiver/sensor box histidine kinase n=1 Tax=Haloglomus litoreum TaxID=3034026 RepID=UPI0023E8D0EB|nr:ATP-binding protein [Haloglomus sp. DT116]